MTKEKIRTYSLSELKDRYIGKIGTSERDEYEYELVVAVLEKLKKTD
jgi:HTH-type transcriptional regulator/antitoxin HipB